MSLHSKMTAIADAIRAKTGHTETLTLDGMATEIESLQIGGGGFPFRIVSGTTQPDSPEANTIWIDTSADIPEWVVGEGPPDDDDGRAEGALWVEINAKSTANVSVEKETEALFIPLKAAYIKQKLVTVDGTLLHYTYVPAKIASESGTWTSLWCGQLYADGNEWDLYTGGWKATAVQSVDGSSASAGSPTITRGDAAITATQATGKSGVFHTASKIDLSDVDTITFTGTFTRGGSAQLNFMAGVWSSFGSYYSESAVASNRMAATSGTSLSVDVTELEGSYYVGIGLSAASKAIVTDIIMT